ncbi:MAG: hypothetical protein AWT59_2272 [Candidatus Gallionella acididurans]|uniref:Uncharacterized protein n=1 Tax=Candidatus Gallionella acididurans TaxID=1796491 RepID=A0A139BRM1_9PROT|nr:MAG: hypothetical protein AWT59_2272 [Candidatus Gallionella acididurans]
MTRHHGIVNSEIKMIRIDADTDYLAGQFAWHRVTVSVLDDQTGAGHLA